MKALCSRCWPVGLLVLLLAAGCSKPLHYPVVLLEAPDSEQPQARVLEIPLGEALYWRTTAGELGQGFLVAIDADTLLVAKQRPSAWRAPVGLQRLALADLQELERWDRQAEPLVSTLFGVSLMIATVGLILFGLALASAHYGG